MFKETGNYSIPLQFIEVIGKNYHYLSPNSNDNE